MKDKSYVLQNTSRLRGYESEEGKDVYINNYLTANIAEMKKRERQIYKWNQEEDELKQLDMKFERGRLSIENAPYQKLVTPPTPKDYLYLTGERLNGVIKMSLTKGGRIDCNGSYFTAYYTKAEDIQDVRNAYLKMRLLHPGARHVICGFRIPGLKRHECEDFCNDGEISGGATILQWMEENKVEDMVMFVVRYCGGSKLGRDRLRCIRDALSSALGTLAPNFDVPSAIETEVDTEVEENETQEKHKQSNSSVRSDDSQRSWQKVIRVKRGRMQYSKSKSQLRGALSGRGGRFTPQAQRKKVIGTGLNFKFKAPENVLNSQEWPAVQNAGKETNYRY